MAISVPKTKQYIHIIKQNYRDVRHAVVMDPDALMTMSTSLLMLLLYFHVLSMPVGATIWKVVLKEVVETFLCCIIIVAFKIYLNITIYLKFNNLWFSKFDLILKFVFLIDEYDSTKTYDGLFINLLSIEKGFLLVNFFYIQILAEVRITNSTIEKRQCVFFCNWDRFRYYSGLTTSFD